MLDKLKATTLCALLLLAGLTAAAQAAPVVLKSPHGKIEIWIATVRGQAEIAEEGRLAYRVAYCGQPVIQWSSLGLALEGAPALGTGMRIEATQTASQNESWTTVQGKANPILNLYNAVTVRAVEPGANGRRLTVEARAYNEGVAFRYVVPEQPALKQVRILNELTQFNFARDAQTWPLISRGFQTSNEDDYHELMIGGWHPEYLVNLPLLLHLPGVAWVGLTEADLEDYPNMFLTATAGKNLAARLAPYVEGANTSAETAPIFDPKADAKKVSVIAKVPVKSGWRVLMIAGEPGQLVESNMVVNLNPPCAIGDPSWIKPGKTAWDWWNGSQALGVRQAGMNNETMKYYIDFAARNKFEFMLIDAGWSARTPTPAGQTGYSRRGRMDLTKTIPAIDMPMLAEYAKSKGVRLWLWAHFRDMADQMDAAFAQYEKWGIAGVKIDFMDRSDQWMVNWYRTAAKKAAEHHLMVDFHGAFKPDGMARTYPNVLTREGVMGAEYNKWSARVTPKHNVTLAFTRMLAGPMDYTPGGFDNVTPAQFVPRSKSPMVMTTRAHQLALYVVFESELQMVSDAPFRYNGQKEMEFLKAVPASWDKTRVVNGEPAKYITVARRHGDQWFIGCITDSDAREIDVPLGFLVSGEFEAEIYSDGPNAPAVPMETVIEKRRVNVETVLRVKLAPAGGCAIRLVPVR